MSAKREQLEKQHKQLEELAQLALQEAERLGADEAKVAASASLKQRLVVESAEFTLANTLENRKLGVAVHKDQKKGSATINTTDPAAVKQAVADALALAKYSVPDDNLCLADKAQAPRASRLDFLWHDDLADLPVQTLQGKMQECLTVLQSDPKVALDRFEGEVNCSWHGLWNSLGVAQDEYQTMATWYFFGMARDGEEVTGFDYDGNFSFDAAGLSEQPLADAKSFAGKVVSQLGPRKCPSYKGAVLLTPRAVREILMGTMLYHMNGRQVMDGKSRWEKDVGNEVVSTLLTIKDHPHDARFSGASAFDSDGLPTQSATLIDQGVLQLHTHDCYSAKKLGAKPNGFSGGPFAMEVAAGTASSAELEKGRGELLVVDRFSGNSDPIKGDFSGVAKSSRLLVNGEDAGAVTETMIAGNILDSLKNVIAVGSEQRLQSGGFLAPAILLDGVSVTGA